MHAPTQAVDRFNNLLVTAFVTPGNARFLLLHDGRNDDNVRAFFGEVYELYVRVGPARRGYVWAYMLLYKRHTTPTTLYCICVRSMCGLCDGGAIPLISAGALWLGHSNSYATLCSYHAMG